MKDSQHVGDPNAVTVKYIKANNERFSTNAPCTRPGVVSISRRIMKDSQPLVARIMAEIKYIKANNERFSTAVPSVGLE